MFRITNRSENKSNFPLVLGSQSVSPSKIWPSLGPALASDLVLLEPLDS